MPPRPTPSRPPRPIPSRPPRPQVSERYREIASNGRSLGFRVTSTTGGTHNRGSLHPRGRAVDFSVGGKSDAQVNLFMAEMRARGYRVRDERTRPRGQRVWRGPHIHVDGPR